MLYTKGVTNWLEKSQQPLGGMGASSSRIEEIVHKEFQVLHVRLETLIKTIASSPASNHDDGILKLQREHNANIIQTIKEICKGIQYELSLVSEMVRNENRPDKVEELRTIIITLTYARQLEMILQTNVRAKATGIDWIYPEVHIAVEKVCNTTVKTWDGVKVNIYPLVDQKQQDSTAQFFIKDIEESMGNIAKMLLKRHKTMIDRQGSANGTRRRDADGYI